MSLYHWILDDEHQPVKVGLMEWARWFEDFDKRQVAETMTRRHRVSTVFLGIDHGWGRCGPPLLFETMVFERKRSIVEWHDGTLAPIHKEAEGEGLFGRYSTWDDAEIGHRAIVRRVQTMEEIKKHEADI